MRLERALPGRSRLCTRSTSSGKGYEWLELHDWENSVIAFLRRAKNPEDAIVVVCNFTPVVRENYRIGVPTGGYYREIFNSDSEIYGGSNVGNQGGAWGVPEQHAGRPFHLSIRVPPLGVLFLKAPSVVVIDAHDDSIVPSRLAAHSSSPSSGSMAGRAAGFLGAARQAARESCAGARIACGISSSIATFQVTWPIATTAVFLRGSSFTTRPGRS